MKSSVEIENLKGVISQYEVIGLNVFFDHNRLLSDYERIKKLEITEDPTRINVVGYRDTNDINLGSGSLYSKKEKKFILDHKEFTHIISHYENTYTEEVVNQVKELVYPYYNIGRVRWMLLNSKSTLSYHTDPHDTLRFHIPIITTDNAFFLVNDKVFRMDTIGQLYVLNTQLKHTAVNTDNTNRLHLVFDTWIKK
jgi:hypothetical protein